MIDGGLEDSKILLIHKYKSVQGRTGGLHFSRRRRENVYFFMAVKAVPILGMYSHGIK
jgi:hypothetical protein